MTASYQSGQNGLDLFAFTGGLTLDDDAGSVKRSVALSNKLTNVLSSSFTDPDVRSALKLLDARGARNAEDLRANLKYDAQKEVIAANARITDDFGKVAKQLQRVGALITILHRTCDDMQTHIKAAKQETLPMLDEASTLIAAKEETESKRQLLDAFNEHFLITDADLTTLTSSAEPVNDHFFTVLARVKQVRKDCEMLLGYENQRLGLELMEQTSANLDGGYRKLYGWIQREFKGLDLEDPRTSGPIRKSLRALSERPTLFKNCLDFFGEARDVTLSNAFQTALTDSTIGTTKAIEFSTHDPLRYIGDMLAWVHSATVSEKEALEGLFISDAADIERGLREGQTSEPWAHLDAATSADATNGQDASSFDGRMALNALISRSMASVSQTLQQRASLTIRHLSDPLTIYKVYNLLLFYEDIFIKLLGSDRTMPSRPPTRRQSQPQYRNQPPSNIADQNTIPAAFSSLQTQSLTLFTTILNEDIESQPLDPPTSNLTPPPILATNLTLLSSILKLRAPTITSQEFTNLYSALISPALHLCSSIADTLTPTTTTRANGTSEESDTAHFQATLFKLNFLFPVVEAFVSLSAADETLAELTAAPLEGAKNEIEGLQELLADLLAENFNEVSGVKEVMALFCLTSDPRITSDDQGQGEHATMDVKAKRNLLLRGRSEGEEHEATSTLEQLSGVLDTFLASALMDAQDDLAKLSHRGMAKAVIAQAVEEFCAGFEKVAGLLEGLDGEWERYVTEKEDGEDEDDATLLQDVYPRTVGEVRALLS